MGQLQRDTERITSAILERRYNEMCKVWDEFAAGGFKLRGSNNLRDASYRLDRDRRNVAILLLLRGALNLVVIGLNFFFPVIDQTMLSARLAGIVEFLVVVILGLLALIALIAWWHDAQKSFVDKPNYPAAHDLVNAIARLFTYSLFTPLHTWIPQSSTGAESEAIYVRTAWQPLTKLSAQLASVVLPLVALVLAFLKLSQFQAMVWVVWLAFRPANLLRLVGLALQLNAFANPALAMRRSLVAFTYSGDLSQAREYEEEAAKDEDAVPSRPDNVLAQRQSLKEHAMLLDYNCFAKVKLEAPRRWPRLLASLRALAWCLTLRESDLRQSMLMRERVLENALEEENERVLELNEEAARREQLDELANEEKVVNTRKERRRPCKPSFERRQTAQGWRGGSDEGASDSGGDDGSGNSARRVMSARGRLSRDPMSYRGAKAQATPRASRRDHFDDGVDDAQAADREAPQSARRPLGSGRMEGASARGSARRSDSARGASPDSARAGLSLDEQRRIQEYRAKRRAQRGSSSSSPEGGYDRSNLSSSQPRDLPRPERSEGRNRAKHGSSSSSPEGGYDRSNLSSSQPRDLPPPMKS